MAKASVKKAVQSMSEGKDWEPTWLYRMGEDGEVVSHCFVDAPPEDPKGWHDNPGACKVASK